MKHTIFMTLIFVLVTPILGQNQSPQSNEAEALNTEDKTLHRAGKYQEAIEAFKNSIRLKPDFALAYNNLGAAYCDSGLYSEAIVNLKEALRLEPDFAEARRNLGAAYNRLGRLEEAIPEFE